LHLIFGERDELLRGGRSVGARGGVRRDRSGGVVEAELRRERAAFLVDRVEQVDAELVHVARIEGEGGPAEHLGRVHAVAARQRGDADRVGGGGEVVVDQHLAERGERRLHRVGHRRRDRLAGVTIGADGDGGLLGRELQEAVDLPERALGHDAGGGYVLRDPFTQELDRSVEVRGERTEAGVEASDALRRVGALQGRDLSERRDGAVHMVGDVQQVEPVLETRERPAADRLVDVGGELPGLVEVGAIELGQLLQTCAGGRLLGGAPGLGRVAQPVVVPLVAHEGPDQRLALEQSLPRIVG